MEQPTLFEVAPNTTDSNGHYSGTVNLISLEEACAILAVSTATGRNWCKSGKLNCIRHIKKPLFLKDDVINLLEDIKSNGKLKSRRNKKHNTGIAIPKDYIQDVDIFASICTVVEELGNIAIDDHFERVILAEYSLKLLYKSGLLHVQNETVPYVYQYVTGNLSLGAYAKLIR